MPAPSVTRFTSETAIGTSVQSALGNWVATRTRLAKSIQEHLSACGTLSGACSALARGSFEGPAIEHALTILDSELDSLATEEDTLRSARFSLRVLRNRSATLAPINSLPPEILANIFALLGPHCTQSHSFDLTFTGVCTYWRKLSLDTPHLWSHIDAGPNVPRGLTNFLLEHAKSGPLHVHAYEPKPDVSKANGTWGPRYAKQVIETLTPHAHRICTLCISSDGWRPEFINQVVNFWLGQGNPSLTRSLMVHQQDPWSLQSLGPQNTSEAAATLANAETVLLSLRTLHLSGTRFDWESAAYRGLVDLQIGFTPDRYAAFISMSQLASVLEASPMLVVLKLGYLVVVRTDSCTQTAPIILNRLKVLNLLELPVMSLKVLLSLIRLPRDCAELSVGIRVYHNVQTQLEDFLDCPSITTLYCAGSQSGFPARPSLLKSLPRVRTLVLDNFHICNRIPPSGASPVLSQSSPSRAPKVILLSCQLTFEGVDSLITKLGICELHIENHVTSFDPKYKEHCTEIKTSLLKTHPRLQCTVSDLDSTRNLPCRVLDYP